MTCSWHGVLCIVRVSPIRVAQLRGLSHGEDEQAGVSRGWGHGRLGERRTYVLCSMEGKPTSGAQAQLSPLSAWRQSRFMPHHVGVSSLLNPTVSSLSAVLAYCIVWYSSNRFQGERAGTCQKQNIAKVDYGRYSSEPKHPGAIPAFGCLSLAYFVAVASCCCYADHITQTTTPTELSTTTSRRTPALGALRWVCASQPPTVGTPRKKPCECPLYLRKQVHIVCAGWGCWPIYLGYWCHTCLQCGFDRPNLLLVYNVTIEEETPKAP